MPAGRPRKATADWFPHYARPSRDEQDIIDNLCGQFGMDRGYAFYYRMKEHLLDQPGYQISDFNQTKQYQLAQRFSIPGRTFCAMISASLKIGGHKIEDGVFFSPWLKQALKPLEQKRAKSRTKNKSRIISDSEIRISSIIKDISNNTNTQSNTNTGVAQNSTNADTAQGDAPKIISESEMAISESEINPEHERLARRIFEGLCRTNEVYRRKWLRPDGTAGLDAQQCWRKWVPQIRLLIEKDGVEIETVDFILSWIFGGTVALKDGGSKELEPWEGDRGFCWYNNIQSGKKLREKFPRLYADAYRHFSGKGRAPAPKQAYSTPIYE